MKPSIRRIAAAAGKPASFFLFVLLICVIPAGCRQGRMHTYQKSKALIDTLVTVTLITESGQQAEKAAEAALRSIEDFGALINFFSDESELSLINRNAGIRKVRVSPLTFDVIEKSLFIAGKSGGAFDPTIGPVIRLWDFHKKTIPSNSDIKKNISLVNYRDVVIDRNDSSVYLRKKGMMLDLGGSAKGYAADIAFKTLREHGISAGIVAVGGEIRTFGLREDGTPWNIGIKNPRQKDEKDEIIGTVRLTDRAISTSGDYERYFIFSGRRFHHILDPATGYPAGNSGSVSVISSEAVFTDSLSTAVFVLGPRRGKDLISEINREFDTDAVIIDGNGTVYETERVRGTIKK